MAYCAYCGSHVTHVSNAPCASCRNPTNGAPVRPAAKGGSTSMTAIIVGIAIGGVVLLAVIGILAAIAVPNLLTAMQRSRQKRTMADMRVVGIAIQSYIEEKNAAPPGHSISEISGELGAVPTTDGWGTLYAYEALPDGGYVIASGGADKKFELGSLLEYEKQTTTNFDCDIVFANGEFVQYPGGN